MHANAVFLKKIKLVAKKILDDFLKSLQIGVDHDNNIVFPKERLYNNYLFIIAKKFRL
jgi:hypothetical protein